VISNILIVEDDSLVALDIREIIEENGFNAIGVCSNGADAITCLKKNKVDFALLDINLKDSISGIDIAKIINKNYNIPFAFITANTDDNTIEEVKQTEPVGFVVKPFDERQIIAAIRIGDYLFERKFSAVNNQYSQSSILTLLPELSGREADVLLNLLSGLTNREIADNLSLSVNTIKVHLRTLFIKLNVNSRLEAVHSALEKLNEAK